MEPNRGFSWKSNSVLPGSNVKHRRKGLLFLLCFLPLSVFAQNTELIQLLEELKRNVLEVKGEKNSYQQNLRYTEDTPYRLEFIIQEIDNKGKSEEKKAVFNLGLLDKDLVRRENSKDLMWVNTSSGGMDVVKVYKDGSLDNYTDALKIYATDIDNARKLEETIKAAIPLAEKAWKESVSLPQNLGALRNYISELVVNVDAGDAEFRQKMELDEQHPARVLLTIDEYTDKGLKKSERFGFNLGDLGESSVRMKVSGKKVSVEADTRQKQEFIRIEESGELKGYGKSISFYTDDVDKAQLLIKALNEAIPLAMAESENMLPKPSSAHEGVELLQQELINFSIAGVQLNQSLSAGPVFTYSRGETNDKGTTEEKFLFDIEDFNDQSVAIEAAKKWYVVEATIKGKQSLVEVWKNGEQQKYGSEIQFFVPDLPTAKKVQHLLRYSISNSSRTISPKDFNWLKNTLAEFDAQQLGLKQSLENREGDNCKLSLTTQQEGKKSVEEHLLEFNLHDIDPEKISMEVKNKGVSLVLPAKFGEEIIKDYENGDKIKYSKEVVLALPNIETGKAMLATIKALVQNCTK